tara:strand:- start:715 stop:951 length:237 start_codon:yes stop_codon:yes gene_type:complete
MVRLESAGFDCLSSADKCEWELICGGDGLQSVDFHKLLGAMAKSVSISQIPLGDVAPVERALFGQDCWGSASGTFTGR